MTRRANGEGSIYKRADGRWEAAAWLPTLSGRRKRIRVYGATRRAAGDRLAKVVSRSAQGGGVPDVSWRLGDYLDYWLEHVVATTRQPTTLQRHRSLINVHLRPVLGGQRLDQLTVAGLQRFFNEQLVNGHSVRSVQLQRNALSAALQRAVREELLTRNVARLVELPQWERQEREPWTSSELAAFLEVSKKDALFPVFMLIITYGLRRAEALGLQWEDVDEQQQRLHVRAQLQRIDGKLQLTRVKTSAGRRVLPLLPHVAQLLQAKRQPRATGYIFRTRTDEPVDPRNLLRSFHRLARQADLPPSNLHYLRHAVATLLKNAGAPARDAQLILGHADVHTTLQLYQHADLDGQRAALSRVHESVLDGYGSRQNQPSTTYFRQQFGRLTVVPRTGFEPVTLGLEGGPWTPPTGDPIVVLRWLRRRQCPQVLGCVAVSLAVSAAA